LHNSNFERGIHHEWLIEKIHHDVDEYIMKPANADASLAILADRLGVRKQEDGKELIKLAGRADT
jgi:hypothetical protein